MKKITAIVCILAVMASLTACSETESPAQNVSGNQTSSQTTTSDETPNEPPADSGHSETNDNTDNTDNTNSADSLSEDPNSGSSGAEESPILPSYQTISDIYNDYYVGRNKVYYVNISDNASWQNAEFTKGDYLGQVLYNTESRDLSSIQPGSSNVLPVGTELYETNEDKTVILAKVNDAFIPYVKVVEG